MLDRRLAHVVATARYGSFTAAAEQVGLTQSALTRSVAELERQLGYEIFERNARGVTLTEPGERFVERARRLLDDAQTLMDGAIVGRDPYAEILRVGVCPTALDYLLLEPVPDLLRRHGGMRIEVSGGSFDRVLQQLRTGSVDVALGYAAAFEDHPDVVRTDLAPLQATFFVRRGHPLLDVETVTAAHLAAYTLVVPSDSRPLDAFVRTLYAAGGVDPRMMIHTVDSFPLTQRIVLGSDALAFTDVAWTRTSSFRRAFARLPFLEALPPSRICCAVRKRWPPRPITRAFIAACEAALA